MGSIDEILSDEPVEATVAPEEVAPEPVEAAPAPEEPAAPVRDDKGRFAPKGVNDGAPPAPVDQLPKDVYEPLKAVRSENQQLKARLEALEKQQNPPAPAPSIWEDEQGWQQHFGSTVVTEAVQTATLHAQLNMSEMMVRQANPDFEEVKAEFLQLAEQNPTLREQALADPHPWNKAYQIAKNHRAMRELGATDLDTLKAKLREELMAEMQAAPAPVAAPALPPTLSTERSVGQRTGPAWGGPKPLSDLLG